MLPLRRVDDFQASLDAALRVYYADAMRRLERVRSERLNVYQQDLSPEALEAYRLADQAYLRARSEAPENPHR